MAKEFSFSLHVLSLQSACTSLTMRVAVEIYISHIASYFLRSGIKWPMFELVVLHTFLFHTIKIVTLHDLYECEALFTLCSFINNHMNELFELYGLLISTAPFDGVDVGVFASAEVIVAIYNNAF